MIALAVISHSIHLAKLLFPAQMKPICLGCLGNFDIFTGGFGHLPFILTITLLWRACPQLSTAIPIAWIPCSFVISTSYFYHPEIMRIKLCGLLKIALLE